MDDPAAHNDASLAFEREKWEVSERRLDREVAVRDRELALRENDAKRARWWNPLIIAIFGASIAAAGSALVSLANNRASIEIEQFKAEAARIFEVIKTGNPDTAAKNLSFLLEAGLIQNESTVKNVRQYLTVRTEGAGVSLPPTNTTSGDCKVGARVDNSVLVECFNLKISELQKALDNEISGLQGGKPGLGPHAAALQRDIEQARQKIAFPLRAWEVVVTG
jgi:hypothetical protein